MLKKFVSEEFSLPVIMLTARGEDTDRIIGLELGADDYLPKPFNPRELVARIKAILRRSEQATYSLEGEEGDTLKAGGLVLDKAKRCVISGGKKIELTTAEYELLRVLMPQPPPMSVPLEKEGQYFGRLNLFWEFEDETFGALFAFGLIGIGGFIALLLLPVSRLITNPIKELHRSALRIADGDLTHRTNIKTKDEIGDLGDAFNQMAEKIERMIKGNRELTANISHELRSPLTRIRIAEELIREGLNEENGDIRKYLDSIQKEISELDSLIGQILLLSKLDISERPFQMDKIDLESVMIEILERMKPLIERNEIQIESEIAPGIPPVLADREAIKTALSNIVDNAVKFCPPGGRVEVSIKPEGGGVRISLANSCDPIPEDDLRRIFDPFYRVEGGGRKTEGAGLGLAITKKIIEGHAGTIEAVNIEWGLQLSAYIPAN